MNGYTEKSTIFSRGYLFQPINVSRLYVQVAGSKFDLRNAPCWIWEEAERDSFSFFNKAHHSQDIHASNLEFVYSTCWFQGLKNIFCHSDLTTDRTGVTSFVLSGHVLKMTRRCFFLCRERIINYRSKSLKNTQKKDLPSRSSTVRPWKVTQNPIGRPDRLPTSHHFSGVNSLLNFGGVSWRSCWKLAATGLWCDRCQEDWFHVLVCMMCMKKANLHINTVKQVSLNV